MLTIYLIVLLVFVFMPLIIATIITTHDKWLVSYIIFIFIVVGLLPIVTLHFLV